MDRSHGQILVVDDDRKLRALLEQYLQENGYDVQTAGGAEEALTALEKTLPDLVVLDVMMPKVTGTELAAQLKKTHADLPILMLTAMDEPADRIRGLEAGADDYLSKPFEPRELLLRLQKLLQRHVKRGTKVQFGNCIFDPETLDLHKAGEYINLSSSEQNLLNIFADYLNSPVPREVIAKAMHGISERSVDVQVTRLRKKIEDNPKRPQLLISRRGQGYVLRSGE